MSRELQFPEKDQALRDDVRTLGEILGEVLKEQGPPELFERVERSRLAARRRRGRGPEAPSESAGQAENEGLEGLPAADAAELVRAFSAYFFLVNMAERVHRIRRRVDYLRTRLEGEGPPQPGGLESVFRRLLASGISADDLAEAIHKLRIEPVFTAHPTEAIRRTLLNKEQRIARALVDRFDLQRLGNRDRMAILARIRNEITAAWQTEEHPDVRPSVTDEVEHVLFYVSDVIMRIVPRFHEDLEEAYARTTGRRLSLDRPVVRFASWVGGDMDGNPNVGPGTIQRTLRRHLELVLRRYRDELRELSGYLSQSLHRVPVSEALAARLEDYQKLLPEVHAEIPGRYADMAYRVFCRFVSARLDATLSESEEGYDGPAEFLADLDMMAESLAQNRGTNAGLFLVRRLVRRARTFGFHLATLDTRQDALVYREVLGELLGDEGFVERSPDERQAAIETLLTEPAGARSESQPGLGEVSEKTLDVFRVLQRARRTYGEDAIGPSIISMARRPDDSLAVLALAHTAGFIDEDGRVPLDIAPLFETVVDLRQGAESLEALFSNAVYREHLRARGDRQVVMLGYSDSNKESGLVASRWALSEAQTELVGVAEKHGVELSLFHGRGGTVSRGGTKPREGIMAAPAGSVRHRLRVTEQGEIIHAKFGLRGIAVRTLELSAGAVIEHSLRLPRRDSATQPEPWREAMERFARTSRATFRELVYSTPEFITYFREATPIDVIERMRIGSRPASRRSMRGIEDLRAIPWVFAWTQSRHILPGWYGVGTGLEDLRDAVGLERLREMDQSWSFFANIISDVEMVLAKADLEIAGRYAALSPEVGPAMFAGIRAEFERTVALICEVREQDELLETEPVLQRAIKLRNPYVDPMSLVQIDLLGRWRAGGREDEALERALVASVQGIARGLQNTG